VLPSRTAIMAPPRSQTRPVCPGLCRDRAHSGLGTDSATNLREADNGYGYQPGQVTSPSLHATAAHGLSRPGFQRLKSIWSPSWAFSSDFVRTILGCTFRHALAHVDVGQVHQKSLNCGPGWAGYFPVVRVTPSLSSSGCGRAERLDFGGGMGMNGEPTAGALQETPAARRSARTTAPIRRREAWLRRGVSCLHPQACRPSAPMHFFAGYQTYYLWIFATTMSHDDNRLSGGDAIPTQFFLQDRTEKGPRTLAALGLVADPHVVIASRSQRPFSSLSTRGRRRIPSRSVGQDRSRIGIPARTWGDRSATVTVAPEKAARAWSRSPVAHVFRAQR